MAFEQIVSTSHDVWRDIPESVRLDLKAAAIISLTEAGIWVWDDAYAAEIRAFVCGIGVGQLIEKTEAVMGATTLLPWSVAAYVAVLEGWT